MEMKNVALISSILIAMALSAMGGYKFCQYQNKKQVEDFFDYGTKTAESHDTYAEFMQKQN